MTTETKPKWKEFLKDNKWTTYLAYELKQNSTNPVDTLLKYEALLTQCSYLSRMAYCPADIFCRMTQHLDVTPNAFNNYIRAIEKIYDKLFNYKCSFDSKYIQEHPEFAKYFNPVGGDIPASQTNAKQVGINASKMNAKQVGIEVLQNNTDKPSMVKLRDRIKLLKNSIGKNNKNNSALSKLASELIGEISTEANSTENVFTLKELLDELYFNFKYYEKVEAKTTFEKIKVKYDKLIQNTPKNSLHNPYPPLSNKNSAQSGGFTNKPIGFFVQNEEHMNVYLYVHHNPESKFNPKKTLFIAFKGSSSINDFIHDIKSAAKEDLFLSELNEGSNTSGEFKMMEMNIGLDDPLINPGEEYGTKTENNKTKKPEQSTPESKNNNLKKSKPSTPQSQNNKKIKPGKGGWGFIHVLKPSIKEICKKIDELKSDNFERVIITGHSLGGALASLFGYYLKQYNPDLIDKPIHVVTFGACCVFDAPGRNEFNEFLNIKDKKVFTLDRVTSNLDPVIVLPPDLDHPGFTLLRGVREDYKSYTKTNRTKEIGEIRDMLGLKIEKTILTADDLLSTENFVKLFSNYNALKVKGEYDEKLYKKKFKISFGTKAEEQYPILENAMPDAKLSDVQKLFKTIETRKKNKLVNIPETDPKKQEGGLHNPFSSNKRDSQKFATNIYKKETKIRMPNQIQYSCYAQITMSFCHAAYLGVSYVMVLRLPNISEGKLRKEPTKDYTLYQKDRRIFSSASGNYTSNSDCSKVESNVQNNSSQKANSGANPGANPGANSGAKSGNRNKNKRGKKSSFMSGLKSGFTGIFKTQNRTNNKKTRNSIAKNSKKQTMNPTNGNPANNPTTENPDEENQGGVFSKCSIL